MESARRAAGAGLSRRRPGRFALLAEAERIGFPVLIKASAGGGGKGMRVVDERRPSSRARSTAPGARRKAAFGDDRVLVEKLSDTPAPYRDPGLRRHARQRRASVRARLLDPAPASEGDRGGAGAGPDAGARAAHGRGRGRGGARGRLCRRRHGRVHRRAGGDVLLHGDEHAPAGRASGDRDDHRARSGRMAVARRRRRAAAAAPGRDRASRPRDRGAALCRRPGARISARDRHACIGCICREGDADAGRYRRARRATR